MASHAEGRVYKLAIPTVHLLQLSHFLVQLTKTKICINPKHVTLAPHDLPETSKRGFSRIYERVTLFSECDRIVAYVLLFATLECRNELWVLVCLRSASSPLSTKSSRLLLPPGTKALRLS